jgi:orotate phosphoribosyltransferase
MNNLENVLGARELALEYFGCGAVLTKASKTKRLVRRGSGRKFEKGFKLRLHDERPNDPLSPYFLDIRTDGHPTRPGPVTEKIVSLTALCLRRLWQKHGCLPCQAVATVPYAADDFGKDLAGLVALPHIGLVKKPGGGCMLGKPLHRIHRAIVIENTVTGGGSALSAVMALRNAGVKVADCITIVDRQQGASDRLFHIPDKDGGPCALHALFTTETLLSYGLEGGEVDEQIFNDIKEYIFRQAA